MGYRRGNIFFRPNMGRDVVEGHGHNFSHVTRPNAGWVLIQALDDSDRVVAEVQACTAEFRRLRKLQLKYEPHAVKRPIRVKAPKVVLDDRGEPVQADPVVMVDHIVFIGLGDAIPDGGEEIVLGFAPHEAEIPAGVRHRLLALSPGADWDCLYSHREPQGDDDRDFETWVVTQDPMGFEEAYS